MWLSSTDPSLVWLHSLVHDRDTEVSIIYTDFVNSLSFFLSLKVCCSGYTILSTLCSQVDSCELVFTSWTDMHTYGLLGACLDTGLDYKEYSWVRHQVSIISLSHIQQIYSYFLLQ